MYQFNSSDPEESKKSQIMNALKELQMSFSDGSSFVEFNVAQEIILEQLKDENISTDSYFAKLQKQNEKYQQYKKESLGKDFAYKLAV